MKGRVTKLQLASPENEMREGGNGKREGEREIISVLALRASKRERVMRRERENGDRKDQSVVVL